MYRLRLTRREKKKLLHARWFIIFGVVCAAGFIVWLAWIRPIQRESQINSFETCVKAGNPVQMSYPEVCLTKNGKRFVNSKQDQAHQAALTNTDPLVPPTNPALLVLDIDEWGVRVPLSMETFDLSYAYIENGESEYVLFTYKRLVRMGVCKGDIGLKLTRSFVQHSPPYHSRNLAAMAQADKAYFYVENVDKPCYDVNNAEQAALVSQIAGDQTLIQATTNLLSKLIVTPKE